MTKHTQGPWYYEGLEMTIENYMGKPVPYAIKNSEERAHPNKNVVAVVDTGAFSQNENLSNARLIAAAPDLLEALEIIVGRLQGSLPVTVGMEKHRLWQAVFLANEAIAKARGE